MSCLDTVVLLRLVHWCDQLLLNSIRSFIGTALFCIVFLLMRLLVARGVLPQHRDFMLRQSQFCLDSSFAMKVGGRLAPRTTDPDSSVVVGTGRRVFRCALR